MGANTRRALVLSGLMLASACQAITGLDDVDTLDPSVWTAGKAGAGGISGAAGKDASAPDAGGSGGLDASAGSGGTGGAGGAGGAGGVGGSGDGGSVGGGAGSDAGGAAGGPALLQEFDLCLFDSDCATGACRAMAIGGTKRCTRLCVASSQCMTGTRCSSAGVCAFDDLGKGCSSQQQCEGLCVAGPGANYCTSECAGGVDCPTGWGCSQPIGGSRVCLRLDEVCAQGSDCAGQVCDDQSLVVAGCTIQCASALDCPQRAEGLAPWTCGSGHCIRPEDIHGPVAKGQATQWACDSTDATRNLCADGITLDQPPALTCNETVATPTTGVCVASCRYEGGCGAGYACVGGLAVLQCVARAVCVKTGAGETGAACSAGSDCLFGVCAAGSCSRDCTADGVCPTGSTCAPWPGLPVQGKPLRYCLVPGIDAGAGGAGGGACDAGLSDTGPGGAGGSGGTGGSGGAPAYSHTISVDGINDFNAGDTFPTSSAGYTAFVSWDATYVYLGIQGADVGADSSTKWLLIYLGGTPGTTTGTTYATQQPTLAFPAHWHMRWRTDSGSTSMRAWDAVGWKDVSWDFNGDLVKKGEYLDLRLARADLANPTKLSLHISLINEAAGQEFTYAGAPATSFIDGYDPNYSKYYEFDLSASKAPNEYAPLP